MQNGENQLDSSFSSYIKEQKAQPEERLGIFEKKSHTLKDIQMQSDRYVGAQIGSPARQGMTLPQKKKSPTTKGGDLNIYEVGMMADTLSKNEKESYRSYRNSL
mmetsp:Transcript_5483/g.5013  ORF Transcript_5483/g.5013 Transcript_5483/m.5013 type:complete len:104 (-) Transcript_5483:1863-2174(-)